MKNFKKIIALVLVVAMISSFATMASAAFTDDADIVHGEAVDVAVAVGIINGMDDGSFSGSEPVTRAQMAKMISYVRAGGSDVSDSYAASCAYTDCGSHWAAKYISYVSTMEIINGYTDGTFAPDANVTGTEAAKMLLTLAGYSAEYEGFANDANWANNIMNYAEDLGLDDDVEGLEWSVALTRDQAAQMILNALQIVAVKYDNVGSTVVLADGTTINTNVPDPEYRTNKWSDNYTDDADEMDYYEQVCERYLEDLTYQAGEEDVLGRGAHEWYYDEELVGVYADTADYVVFADDTYSYGTDIMGFLQDEIDDDLYDSNADFYFNGAYKTSADAINVTVGDVIEVITDKDAVESVVVLSFAHTTIEDIEEEDDLEDCVIEMEDGSEMTYDDSINFSAIYAAAEIGADILVVKDGNTVVYAEYPTIVTGDITYVNSSDSYVKMDGTTYNYTSFAGTPETTADDAEAALYINSYGYVVYTDSTDDSNDDSVLAVIKTYSSTNSDGELIAMAKVVYSDGTTASIQLGKVGNNDITISNMDTYVNDGTFYAYTEDDDVYDLTTLAAGATATNAFVDNSATNVDIFSSSAKYVATSFNFNDYYYSDDVLFIFVDNTDDDVEVYEGVTSYTTGASSEDIMIAYNDDEDIVAVFVYGDADDEVADEVVFIKGYTGTTKVNGETYKTYEAYLNGEEIEDFYADAATSAYGFYEYSINDDGDYELTAKDQTDCDWDVANDEEYVYATDLTLDDVTGDKYITFDVYNGTAYTIDDLLMSGAEIVDLDGDESVNSAAELQDLFDEANGAVTFSIIADLDAGEALVIFITDYTV